MKTRNFLPLRHLAFSVVAVILGTPFLPAADWTVSPDGNDGNAGTAASPFRTIGHALDRASSGDTVFLETGTYGERVRWSGGPGTPITLRAAAAARPVLDSPSSDPALTVSGGRDLVLDGLEFRGPLQVGFGSESIEIRNCSFIGIPGTWAVQINSAADVIIDNCNFENNRWSEILSLVGDNRDITVRHCRFIDNFSASPLSQGTIQLSGQSPAGAIRIEFNRFQLSDNRSARPALTPDNDAAAILLIGCDGGDPEDPRIRIRLNSITGYRFPGTLDDRSYDPSYLKTPAQGGERGNGISLVDSRAILVSDNQIRLASTFGIIGFRSTNSTIRKNQIDQCGINGIFWAGSSATLDGGSPNLFDSNRIADCGWLVGGGSGISTIHVGPGNQILRNIVTGQQNGTAGTVGADWYGDGNGILADLDSPATYIAGNIVADNQGAGISVNRSSDSVVVHNTILGNGYGPHFTDNAGLLIAGGAGPSDRITVVNNLLYNNRRAQFWVWMTALDHEVRNNLYAAGPLTLPEFGSRVIDWYGSFYTVEEWRNSPPRAGNGSGAVTGVPVFLGDMIASLDASDPNRYLPVNASPGTGDAAPDSTLPAPISASVFPDAFPVFQAPAPFGAIRTRRFTGANLGAVEPPPGGLTFNGGRWIGFIEDGPNDSWVWGGRLLGMLQWRGGWVESPTLGPVVLGEFGTWVFTDRFGWIWEAADSADIWFWSQAREDWIGVLPDGGLWSTRDQRFL